MVVMILVFLTGFTAPSSGSSDIATVRTCGGEPATIVGTPQRDIIEGTPGRDVIVGLGGADVIDGLGGQDLICGGSGSDDIRGGPGDDELWGQKGDDLLRPGGGDDVARGSIGSDIIAASGGRDEINGGPGNDRIEGGRGADELIGGDDGDTVAGGPGHDTMHGGQGTDVIEGGTGADVADGGAGIDNCRSVMFKERCERSCVQADTYEMATLTLDLVNPNGNRPVPTTVRYPTNPGGPDCGPFPLVVVGHGAQGTGASAVQYHEFLVRSGYVVAGPTLEGFNFGNHTSDIGHVLTAIARRSRRASGPLSGLVATDRVGYIGTSMGGMVGLAFYQRNHLDDRIDAIVPKAGMAVPGDYAWSQGPPLLMLHGDADTVVPYANGLAAYESAAPPKGMIRLSGVDHSLNTGGSPILRDAPLAFFDRYLRNDPEGLERVDEHVDATPIASLLANW